MANATEQKVLCVLLCRFTDEDHALHTDEILFCLPKMSHKILLKDIALLNEYDNEMLS